MSDSLIDQALPETFAAELSRIDRIGSARRLIFTIPSADTEGYKSVVVKLIVPADYMATLACLIAGGEDRARREVMPDLALAAFEPEGQAN
jgi:hypothetical protein